MTEHKQKPTTNQQKLSTTQWLSEPLTNKNIDRLRFELSSHPDKSFVEYLCSSLEHEFDTLVPDHNLPTFECKNSLSAQQNPSTVDELLQTELDKGYVKGHFLQPPFNSYRVRPLGIATHKYSGKKRLIFDLSSPHNKADPSVNGLINKEQCSLSYVKIDDAIQLIQQFGIGSLMCKRDMICF